MCSGSDVADGQEAEEDCRNVVDKIVKQSLDRNMKSMASVDLTSVKLLVMSSSYHVELNLQLFMLPFYSTVSLTRVLISRLRSRWEISMKGTENVPGSK